MWRTEVFHPLSVHFPIVLLLIGTISFLSYLLLRKNKTAAFLLPASRLLLWLGVVSVWVAIYTGDQAGGVVTRQLCDPTILKQHENYAYWIGYIFTLGTLLETSVVGLKKKHVAFTKPIMIISCVLFILGTGFLMYVGHLGASLVYQQGAGVYHPSEDCHEFN